MNLPSLNGVGSGKDGDSDTVSHKHDKQAKKILKKEEHDHSKPPSRSRSAASATLRGTFSEENADLKPDWGFAEGGRAHSRQGGSRPAQPADEGNEIERGRIRPKSGSRSRKSGGSRPPLAPSTNNPVEPPGV